MDKHEIKLYIEELNNELKRMDVKGELCLYGGAVMCLVFDARPSTKDVDAIFKPVQQMRLAAKYVAENNNLHEHWLNDAVKGFIVNHTQQILFDLSNLKIYTAEPDYLLAMKTLAARIDTTDKQDIQFLIEHMGIKTAEEVFSILEKYYPHQKIKPAAQYFIEEIFDTC
ncbi:MAG: DUF6036 family nucleotidyltransferase [bacterium]